jgi:hypothetical protein
MQKMELIYRVRPSPANLAVPAPKFRRSMRLDPLVSAFRSSSLIRQREHQPSVSTTASGLTTWGNNGCAVGNLHTVSGSVPADVGRADDFCK